MKAPKEIYLQFDPDGEKSPEWFDGVTWCQDKINESDQKYIRADLVIMRRDMIKHAIGPAPYDSEELGIEPIYAATNFLPFNKIPEGDARGWMRFFYINGK